MSLTVVKGLQSEIYVPITPPAVWTPVTKEIKDMSIALATAAVSIRKARKDLILPETSHGERLKIQLHPVN